MTSNVALLAATAGNLTESVHISQRTPRLASVAFAVVHACHWSLRYLAMIRSVNPLILRYNALQCSPLPLSRLSDLWKAVDGSTPSLMDAAAYVNTEVSCVWAWIVQTVRVSDFVC